MVENKKTAAQQSSSRTIGIVAVVVLIVVAIAGIVLAGRKGSDPVAPAGEAPAVAAAPAASATASTAEAASAPTGLPNELMFAAGSDKLPAGATEKIAKFVDGVRSGSGKVRISARFLTGANKAKDFELAKARTGAVRHAVMADGIGDTRLQAELIEMPAGSLSPVDANRVVLSVQP